MYRDPDMELIEMQLERGYTPKVDGYADEETRFELLNPNDIVIEDEQIHIEFRYPLATPVMFTHSKKGGFTRLDIFRLIYEGYKYIYEQEEKEVGDPGTYERSYNRQKSTGKYGIWGHYISDLWIEFVYYKPAEKTIYLRIGS